MVGVGRTSPFPMRFPKRRLGTDGGGHRMVALEGCCVSAGKGCWQPSCSGSQCGVEPSVVTLKIPSRQWYLADPVTCQDPAPDCGSRMIAVEVAMCRGGGLTKNLLGTHRLSLCGAEQSLRVAHSQIPNRQRYPGGEVVRPSPLPAPVRQPQPEPFSRRMALDPPPQLSPPPPFSVPEVCLRKRRISTPSPLPWRGCPACWLEARQPPSHRSNPDPPPPWAEMYGTDGPDP